MAAPSVRSSRTPSHQRGLEELDLALRERGFHRVGYAYKLKLKNPVSQARKPSPTNAEETKKQIEARVGLLVAW